MRVLVVTNPRATTTTARQRDVLVHALASDAKLDIEETANRGHAAALACRAMRDRFDVVVALGGDGTVNEVVNGLLTDGVHPDVPALGVVPGGSTNVFARALGLPNDPFEATSVLIDAMAARRTRQIGLGRADDRYFLFTAGLGYDAAVVAAVEGHRRRGRTSTHSLYVRTAVTTFFRQDRRHPKIRLEHADGRAVDDLYMALVNNCDPWTYLGAAPVSPTPQASFDTGLDVYARTRMGAPGLLLAAARMVNRASRPSTGTRSGAAGSDAAPAAAEQAGTGGRARGAIRAAAHRVRPSAQQHRGRDRASTTRLGARIEHDLADFVLTAREPLPFQVDGDALDARNEVRFRSVPNAVRVLV